MFRLLALILVVVLAIVILQQLPDIQRYLRLRSM